MFRLASNHSWNFTISACVFEDTKFEFVIWFDLKFPFQPFGIISTSTHLCTGGGLPSSTFALPHYHRLTLIETTKHKSPKLPHNIVKKISLSTELNLTNSWTFPEVIPTAINKYATAIANDFKQTSIFIVLIF